MKLLKYFFDLICQKYLLLNNIFITKKYLLTITKKEKIEREKKKKKNLA